MRAWMWTDAHLERRKQQRQPMPMKTTVTTLRARNMHKRLSMHMHERRACTCTCERMVDTFSSPPCLTGRLGTPSFCWTSATIRFHIKLSRAGPAGERRESSHHRVSERAWAQNNSASACPQIDPGVAAAWQCIGRAAPGEISGGTRPASKQCNAMEQSAPFRS